MVMFSAKQVVEDREKEQPETTDNLSVMLWRTDFVLCHAYWEEHFRMINVLIQYAQLSNEYLSEVAGDEKTQNLIPASSNPPLLNQTIVLTS